jgi:hypothetical protein
MKDFSEWMVDTGKSRQLQELNSTMQQYAQQPVTGSFGSAMDRFNQRADKVGNGRNKNKGIIQMIRKYAQMLPPHFRKALGRELIGGIEKDAVGDQSLNPKARFGQSAEG